MRPGAEASAIEDGQRNGHHDALLDADQSDRQQGDLGQPEFKSVIVGVFLAGLLCSGTEQLVESRAEFGLGKDDDLVAAA